MSWARQADLDDDPESLGSHHSGSSSRRIRRPACPASGRRRRLPGSGSGGCGCDRCWRPDGPGRSEAAKRAGEDDPVMVSWKALRPSSSLLCTGFPERSRVSRVCQSIGNSRDALRRCGHANGLPRQAQSSRWGTEGADRCRSAHPSTAFACAGRATAGPGRRPGAADAASVRPCQAVRSAVGSAGAPERRIATAEQLLAEVVAQPWAWRKGCTSSWLSRRNCWRCISRRRRITALRNSRRDSPAAFTGSWLMRVSCHGSSRSRSLASSSRVALNGELSSLIDWYRRQPQNSEPIT